MSVRLDHIALAAHRLADVTPFLVGVLGGAPAYGATSRFFSFAHWRYAGRGRLEVLEPRGDDGFLHRFLATHGPGVHHVTFQVPSLAETCARAEAHGYTIVGRDESDPHWKEAFFHPKHALGIVVQLAEMSRGSGDGGSPKTWVPPAAPPDPPPAVTVLGLRLRARSVERAELQWSTILEGAATRGEAGELIYRWERSALRLAVDVDPAADEGPVAIEITADRDVELPRGPHPVLGAAFVRR